MTQRVYQQFDDDLKRDETETTQIGELSTADALTWFVVCEPNAETSWLLRALGGDEATATTLSLPADEKSIEESAESLVDQVRASPGRVALGGVGVGGESPAARSRGAHSRHPPQPSPPRRGRARAGAAPARRRRRRQRCRVPRRTCAREPNRTPDGRARAATRACGLPPPRCRGHYTSPHHDGKRAPRQRSVAGLRDRTEQRFALRGGRRA